METPRYSTIIDHVPIFHEHTDEDTTWSPDVLAKVVAVNNDRYSRGETSCIIVGHTEDDDDKPACVGQIDQLELGDRQGIPTIFARLIVDDAELVTKQYPYRSVEIDLGDFHMPYLAVLSNEEPALELGTLFSRESQMVIRYSKSKIEMRRLHKQKEKTMDVTPELEAAVEAYFAKSAEFEFIRQLMGNAEAAVDSAESAVEAADEEKADEQAAEESGEEESFEKDDEQKGDESDSEDESSNDEPAGDDDASEEKKDDDDDEKKKMSKELAQLKSKLRRTEREKALVSLAHEGYGFDVVEELEQGEGLDDEQFDVHTIQKIRKYCKRSVVQKFSKIEKPMIDKLGQAEMQDNIARCQAYAREHKVSFQAAATSLGIN